VPVIDVAIAICVDIKVIPEFFEDERYRRKPVGGDVYVVLFRGIGNVPVLAAPDMILAHWKPEDYVSITVRDFALLDRPGSTCGPDLHRYPCNGNVSAAGVANPHVQSLHRRRGPASNDGTSGGVPGPGDVVLKGYAV
jgi:hypothetical protein